MSKRFLRWVETWTEENVPPGANSDIESHVARAERLTPSVGYGERDGWTFCLPVSGTARNALRSRAELSEDVLARSAAVR